MDKLEGFTPDMLWTFVIVLLGLCAVALTVLNLISKIRELRKPKDENRKTVTDMLANDNRRIEKLEKVTGKQQDELKLLMMGELAILHHMIDGNHTSSLKEAQSQMEYFLTYGKLPD